MKHLKKLLSWMCAVVLIGGLTLCTSCTSNKDNAPSVEASEFIPKAPDYNDATMWVTADGDTDGTGADIFYVVSTWEEDWTQRTMVNGQRQYAIMPTYGTRNTATACGRWKSTR
jgi:hypothetical protein